MYCLWDVTCWKSCDLYFTFNGHQIHILTVDQYHPQEAVYKKQEASFSDLSKISLERFNQIHLLAVHPYLLEKLHAQIEKKL